MISMISQVYLLSNQAFTGAVNARQTRVAPDACIVFKITFRQTQSSARLLALAQSVER
jgi:hypothetical protein